MRWRTNYSMLVARRPDPRDRRRNVIELTEPGAETLRRATKASDEAERRLLTALTQTEAVQLRKLLGRVVGVPELGA